MAPTDHRANSRTERYKATATRQREHASDTQPGADDAIGGRPPVVTRHSIKIADTELTYTATTGWLPMKDESGKLHANMFFVAYTKKTVRKAIRIMAADHVCLHRGTRCGGGVAAYLHGGRPGCAPTFLFGKRRACCATPQIGGEQLDLAHHN